jgi:hypothetical protein
MESSQRENEHEAEVEVATEQDDADLKNMPHDSMVTVRLSEPPNLTVDTSLETTRNRNSIVLADGQDTPVNNFGGEEDIEEEEESPRITMMDPNGNEVVSPSGSESAASHDGESRRESDSSEGSVGEVNWEELEKTEEQEPRDQGSDDASPDPTVARDNC